MHKILIDPKNHSQQDYKELENYLNEKSWGFEKLVKEPKVINESEKIKFKESWKELEGLLRGKNLIE